MSQSRSYRSSLAYGLLSFLSTTGLGVVTSIAIARTYGIEVVGLYALVLAPTSAMWTLSSMREQSGLVRELASLEFRAPRVTGLFTAIFAFSTALTTLVAIVMTLVIYFLYQGPIGHPELFAPAVVSIIGYTVLQNPSWNIDMLFSAFRSGRDLFAVRLSSTTSYVVLAVGMGLIWKTVWSLVFAQIFSSAYALVRRVIKSRRLMRYRVARPVIRDGFGTLPSMVKFGLKLTPGVMADGVASQAGTWLLGVMSSVVSVGAYNRAWTLGTRLRDVNFRIDEVLFPTLVSRRAAGDQQGIDRVLVDSMRYQSAAMLLVAAAGGGAAHSVMALFGEGFDRGANALALILLMPAIVGIITIQGSILVASDRPWITSVTSITRMVITLVLMVVLTAKFGLTGTAVASVVGYVVSGVWNSYLARPYMGTRVREWWTPKQMLGQGLAYGLGFIVARLVDDAIPGPGGLIVALVAGGLAYLLVFSVFGGVNARDRRRIREARRKLRERRRPAPAPATAMAADADAAPTVVTPAVPARRPEVRRVPARPPLSPRVKLTPRPTTPRRPPPPPVPVAPPAPAPVAASIDRANGHHPQFPRMALAPRTRTPRPRVERRPG